MTVHVALPPDKVTAVHPDIGEPPSKNSTVAVGVPEPGADTDTVAVYVTFCPTIEGFGDEDTEVDVDAFDTLRPVVLEDATKLESPE